MFPASQSIPGLGQSTTRWEAASTDYQHIEFKGPLAALLKSSRPQDEHHAKSTAKDFRC